MQKVGSEAQGKPQYVSPMTLHSHCHVPGLKVEHPSA